MDLVWIALSLMLIAMSKGGFPVGGIAMPLLILVWPGQTEAARLLCLTGGRGPG